MIHLRGFISEIVDIVSTIFPVSFCGTGCFAADAHISEIVDIVSTNFTPPVLFDTSGFPQSCWHTF